MQIFLCIYRHWTWSEVSHFPGSLLTINVFDKRPMCMLDSTRFGVFNFIVFLFHFAVSLQTFPVYFCQSLTAFYARLDGKPGHTTKKNPTLCKISSNISVSFLIDPHSIMNAGQTEGNGDYLEAV